MLSEDLLYQSLLVVLQLKVDYMVLTVLLIRIISEQNQMITTVSFINQLESGFPKAILEVQMKAGVGAPSPLVACLGSPISPGYPCSLMINAQ